MKKTIAIRRSGRTLTKGIVPSTIEKDNHEQLRKLGNKIKLVNAIS